MRLPYNVNFHIHSCLSPCADDEMTPMNIAGMAKLGDFDIVALTDHNTTKNCPAFFAAARAYGIIPIAGIELTTSEDIHAVCLFPSLEAATLFETELDGFKTRIENHPDIFGKQTVIGFSDEPLYEEPYLLPVATGISLEDLPALLEKYGGVCYPAHIDKDANGVIAILGTFPETPVFNNFELRDISRLKEFEEKYGLKDKYLLFGSDAHFLEDVGDAEYCIFLDTDGSEEDVVKKLFLHLRNPIF